MKLDNIVGVELIEDKEETMDEFDAERRCRRRRSGSPFAKHSQFAASAQKIKGFRMVEASSLRYQNM